MAAVRPTLRVTGQAVGCLKAIREATCWVWHPAILPRLIKILESALSIHSFIKHTLSVLRVENPAPGRVQSSVSWGPTYSLRFLQSSQSYMCMKWQTRAMC